MVVKSNLWGHGSSPNRNGLFHVFTPALQQRTETIIIAYHKISRLSLLISRVPSLIFHLFIGVVAWKTLKTIEFIALFEDIVIGTVDIVLLSYCLVDFKKYVSIYCFQMYTILIESFRMKFHAWLCLDNWLLIICFYPVQTIFFGKIGPKAITKFHIMFPQSKF